VSIYCPDKSKHSFNDVLRFPGLQASTPLTKVSLISRLSRFGVLGSDNLIAFGPLGCSGELARNKPQEKGQKSW
jgi:hypothetical protein